MKVAVISDIHDNLINLDKVLRCCRQRQITEIICCGDVAGVETLEQLAQYPGNVHLVFGNMDLDYQSMAKLPQQYPNLISYGEVGEVVLAGTRIAFVHEPEKIEPYLAAAKIKPVIIFYGHTHKPWEEVRQGIRTVNPGNVANLWYAPTFALFDMQTNQLELVMVNQL